MSVTINKYSKKKLSDLPDDVILYVWDFLETSDICKLRKSCDIMLNISNRYGYIRDLTIDRTICFISYINILKKHKRSLIKTTIKGLVSPLEWIAGDWTKSMVFSHCYFGNKKINPPINSKTEDLNITVWCDRNHFSYLDLNYSNLPNLKKLYVSAPDMNLKLLEHCRDLEVIVLKMTKIERKELPKFIAELPKLKTLIVNCEAKEPLHFKSPYLKKLFFFKQHPCTATSKTIPDRHLKDNIYFEVDSIDTRIE